CTGCTLCNKRCPEKAIAGKPKEPQTIDEEKCIKCGVCRESCKFEAVLIE
ncbi:MAG: 4Fe-4S binding protein, partial [Planctomycetota bacterium]